jgi:hypothetical protein
MIAAALKLEARGILFGGVRGKWQENGDNADCDRFHWFLRK